MQTIIRRRGPKAAVEASQGPVKPLVSVCAWCNMARVFGEYRVPYDRATMGVATHGICPRCGEKMEAEWQLAKARLNRDRITEHRDK